MLTKRRLDWIRGNNTVVLMAAVAGSVGAVSIFASAYRAAHNMTVDNVSFVFLFVFLSAVLLCLIRAIYKTGEGRQYPYALTFQKWQDHELPDPREATRVDQMICYVLRRKMPHKLDCYHGVPYQIRFLYEDDLHEANLAV